MTTWTSVILDGYRQSGAVSLGDQHVVVSIDTFDHEQGGWWPTRRFTFQSDYYAKQIAAGKPLDAKHAT